MKGPILLNMTGRKALVVGCGRVGCRRAKILVEYGCDVMMTDRDEGVDIPEGAVFVKESKIMGRMSEMDIVVAATDDKVINAMVLNHCQAYRVLCNSVDDPEGSDYIFPAVVRRGDLTLAVCTEGASPSLTKKIAAELSEAYGQSYEKRTALLRKLRERTLAEGLPEAERLKILRAQADMTAEELEKEWENA